MEKFKTGTKSISKNVTFEVTKINENYVFFEGIVHMLGDTKISFYRKPKASTKESFDIFESATQSEAVEWNGLEIYACDFE